jgi:mono/diheme cytochrome c family protein
MMRGVLLVLGLEALAGLIFCIVVLTGGFPMGADTHAPLAEAAVGGLTRYLWVSSHAPKGNSPVPVNDATLIHGAQLYQADCAFCHGGIHAAVSPMGQDSYPGAPQFLKRSHAMGDPPGQIFEVIDHGIRFTGMPGWEHAMSSQDVWTLVNFLKQYKNLPPAVETAWEQMPPSPVLAVKNGTLAAPTAPAPAMPAMSASPNKAKHAAK